ncbi:MAG TPA: ATP-binding protein, partial [Pseudonocardiaceae bacterium]|nr:ATP-binding protein [Pseudonocardiaceae bacterium]
MSDMPVEVDPATGDRTSQDAAPVRHNRGNENTVLPLVGRSRECAQLAHLLTTVATGHSAVLVVHGAAGIGKTALVDHVASTATGHRVVRVRGVAAEADLPYSALHLLCSVLATELAELARYHREVIETAVGMRPGSTPDRFVVGVATVALLTVAGGSRPLLCVVDDVQWVDDALSYVLAFAARRLGSAPVALLLAGRGGGVTGLPELVLDRLGHADARLLAESAMSASMDDAVIERI